MCRGANEKPYSPGRKSLERFAGRLLLGGLGMSTPDSIESISMIRLPNGKAPPEHLQATRKNKLVGPKTLLRPVCFQAFWGLDRLTMARERLQSRTLHSRGSVLRREYGNDPFPAEWLVCVQLCFKIQFSSSFCGSVV